MISFRLPENMEDKLNKISEQSKLSKSHIIKEALKEYLVNMEEKLSPYETGKDFFGKYGSGDGNLSTTYKNKIKEKINEKSSY
jgi:Arc/MetJ-type ribon-helix-helix transcriptional regulator